MTANQHSTMTLVYYQGAYGPTLRLYAREPDLLHRLREVFLALAEGKVQEFHLHEAQFVRPLSSVRALVLRVESDGKYSGKHLRIAPGKSSINKFIRKAMESVGVTPKTAFGVTALWSGPTEYWQVRVALIGGMIDFAPKPCHQYFTQEKSDDALIELDFLEGRDISGDE